MNDAVRGLIAGAAGSVALNVTTYLDMTIRGRPASKVPAKVAGRMGEATGIEPLSGGDGNRGPASNRRTGAGALLGYVAGLGIGAAYGSLDEMRRGAPPSVPLAAVGLGLAAMAASDVPATVVGATDPREWSASGWAADIVPHLAYGLVTAATYDALRSRPRNGGMLGRLTGS